MYTYSQSAGTLRDNNSKLLGTGYSGKGDGFNYPDFQNVKELGPIPRGLYTIGKAYKHPHLGTLTMNLEPDKENEMFGRSEFRIHGRKYYGDLTASTGCIVQEYKVREFISLNLDIDDRLQVIE